MTASSNTEGNPFSQANAQKPNPAHAETARRNEGSTRMSVSRGQLNGEPLGDVVGQVFRLQT